MSTTLFCEKIFCKPFMDIASLCKQIVDVFSFCSCHDGNPIKTFQNLKQKHLTLISTVVSNPFKINDPYSQSGKNLNEVGIKKKK